MDIEHPDLEENLVGRVTRLQQAPPGPAEGKVDRLSWDDGDGVKYEPPKKGQNA